MEHLFTKLLLTMAAHRMSSGQLAGKIVGGYLAKIEDFPHSACLSIECETNDGHMTWLCGASIVNQKILLTASHCLEDSIGKANVVVNVGSANLDSGISILAQDYRMHEKYDTDTIENDIALVVMKKNIPLGNKIKRVVLMSNPPYQDAKVAGWGLIDEIKSVPTTRLAYLKQSVVTREKCMQKIKAWTPEGTMCGTVEYNNKQYASGGDSGSALVVRNMIQIGLVSYKNIKISRSMVIYTNVSYFISWIKRTCKKLYCEYKL